MKKIIYLFILVVMVALASCVDLLQDPKSDLTPETIVWNKKTLDNNADGLYFALRGGNYGYNCRMMWVNLAADDVITGSLSKAFRTYGRDQLQFDALLYNADVSILYSNSGYGAIAQANLLIRDLGANEDTEKYAPYIAEAKFIRAFAYFNLVRLFGDVPGIVDPDQIDIFGSKNIVRNKTIDIYNYIIIPDLEYAIKGLSPAGRDNTCNTASIDAAKLCLAEVYLTMAQWPLKLGEEYYKKSQELALQVINSSQGYDLIEYADLWKENTKTSRKEHIFAIAHNNANGNYSNYGSSYSNKLENSGAWQDYMADSLFFENYPADKRRDFNFVSAFRGIGLGANTKYSFRSSRVAQNDQFTAGMKMPGIKKYEDYGPRGADGKPNNNTPQTYGITSVYRLPDAYFIYAEAQTRGGTLAPDINSIDYIEKIRNRAYRDFGFSSKYVRDEKDPNYYKNRIADDVSDGVTSKPANGKLTDQEKTPAGFIKALYDERGWEFFSEFRRWFELVRTERVAEVNKANKRINPSNLQGTNCYLLPLPPTEVSKNGWVNNPGW